MYSDLLESPAKDCFLFNDQSSSYTMSEMNDINNQTNLDYFFNTYYSSVSRYNTGLELAEDCKNMSFSELFDQELFSSQENKDCKLTIKIEKEEPLIPCYTIDDSQDITDSPNLMKIDENVPSSSFSKNFAPKRGINRTSIKSNDNCNVQNLICNPFCESEDLGINQASIKVKTSIVKHEPKDINVIIEQNIVGMRVKSCYSENSQNTIDSNNFDNIEDNFLYSVPKCSTPIPQGIIRTSIKSSDNCDDEHLIHNPFPEIENHRGLDQMSVKLKLPVIKREPENVNDTIEQNIIGMQLKPVYSHDPLNINNSHNFGMNENNNLSSLSKSAIPKHQHIENASIQMIKNSNAQHLVNNYFCTAVNLGIDKPLMKIKIPIVKREPEDATHTVVQDIAGIQVKPVYSHDPQNIKNSHNFEISESPGPNCQGITKTSAIMTKNSDVTQPMYNSFCKTVHLGVEKPLMKIKIPIVKLEPEDTSDIEQNIVEMQIKPYPHNLQNTINSYNIGQTVDNNLPLFSENLAPKSQSIKNTLVKMTKNSDGQHLINNSFCKTVQLGVEKPLMKIKLPMVKLESEDSNDTIEQNIIEKQVKSFYSHDSKNVKCNNLNFVKIKDNKSISLSESSTQKCRGITKTNIVMSNNFDVIQPMYNSYKTVDLGINQPLVKLEKPIVKHEPDDISDINEQDITNSYNYVKIEKSNSSLLFENSVLKPLDNTKASINMIRNGEIIQPMYNSFYKTVDLGINQPLVKLENPIVKCEPEDVNDINEQNIFGMEVEIKEENNIGLNDFQCTNLNSINIDCNEVTGIVKKEDIVINNIISFNNNNSHTSTIKNEINLETEKKKISWEEFRAKREKLGLLTLENKNETTTELSAIDNDKLDDVIEEFNRNTAEHFIGGKRKMEEKEEKNEVSNEEDELQKKRMKIEYIKKLLPSSFASEIAKTSSLMKGSSVEIENESTSDDSIMSTQGRYTDIHEDLGYLKKVDKFQKKDQIRAHSSQYSSRSDYIKKSSRSSSISSGSDDYYNRNSGQYGKNVRNIIQRPKKKVVYVGQIPIKLGKRYLYQRFKKFGTIQSLTLHKKPDFRVYYAFVTYSENLEAERAISHGNDDQTQVQLDIRFGERKQTQVPYYDLDDEWLTDWYGYNNQPLAVVSTQQSPEKTSFEEELQEFSKLAQIKKKINQIKSSQVS